MQAAARAVACKSAVACVAALLLLALLAAPAAAAFFDAKSGVVTLTSKNSKDVTKNSHHTVFVKV